jgi:hypothetical protein
MYSRCTHAALQKKHRFARIGLGKSNFCDGAHMTHKTTQNTRPVRETATHMIARHHAMIPLYYRAVAEENLQDLILARHEMVGMVEQVDKAIAECLIRHIEQGLAKG